MQTLASEKCRRELIQRLRKLRPDNPRQWGRMSAHQMVCHLCDACRMATGETVPSQASGPLQRTLIKWLALYVPVRWPPGIPTRPEIDQQAGGTCPQDWARDLAEVEALVESMVARGSSTAWPAHPIFGRMSQAAWLRWGYLHIDHHLRQFGA